MENEIVEVKEKKQGKGLFITGIIFLTITLIFFFLFSYAIFDAMKGNDLGGAVGIIISIIYLFAPGIVFNLISIGVNIASYFKCSKEDRKTRIIPLIISIITFVLFIIWFVYLQVRNI